MLRILSVLAALAVPSVAAAHEFWIDVKDWQVPAGGDLVADLRVGESFEGPTYSYLPPRIARFDIVIGDTTHPVEGRPGDKPALNMAAPAEGLAVVVHVTTDYSLTYANWDLFASFLIHKDWAQFIELHRARDLPETGFKERYARYGKALVAVGDGGGSDIVAGLETEITALANPYTADLSGGLPVAVSYQGAPRVDAQVELFAMAPDGSVAVTTHRTDAEGIAVLPVTPGHEYLVDAVVVRPVEPTEEDSAVWESLWASLSFRVPG